MTSTSKLRVAICGGGISGLCLLYGLRRHSKNLDTTLYEASSEVAGDEGSGVGLSQNAIRALNLIDPVLVQAVKDSGSIPLTDPIARLMQGAGDQAGTRIIDVSSKTGQPGYLFQRSKFVQQLFKLVPPESCKTSKKLISIDSTYNNEYLLTFADGSTEAADIVLGGDGVHSAVRKHVLAEYPEQIDATFCKQYMHVAMIPMVEASPIMDQCDESSIIKYRDMQYGWIGNGTFLMHDPANDGQTLQVIAAVLTDEEWSKDQWVKDKSADSLREHLRQYGKLGDAAVKLLSGGSTGPLPARSIWEHPRASTYNRHNAAILGDAAHCHQPWQAAGAGQAIEDSMILISLLAEVQEKRQVASALQAYTDVRKSRTHYVQDISADMGLILTSTHPRIQNDVERIRKEIPHRWDEMWYFDLTKHRADAIARYRELLA